MFWLRVVLVLLIALPPLSANAAPASGRDRKLLDFGWRFRLGNAADPTQDFGYESGNEFAKAGQASGAAAPDFDDSTWRKVNLPHDWAVELPFVHIDDANQVAHGSKPIGPAFPATSIGWYRKTFSVSPNDEGKRFTILFEGVFRDSQTWLNGHYLGRETSGYSSFYFDATDYLNFDKPNVLVVRVNATRPEGWFYEGAGIYRHVWLISTSPVHIAQWGTYVTTPSAGRSEATVQVRTQIANDSDQEARVSLSSAATDDHGNSASESPTEAVAIPPYSAREVAQTIHLHDPKLWSPEHPNMYTLVSTLTGTGADDRYETPFGIRTFRFDKDKGFFLNGEHLEIKGTCNHQDHAGVGVAVPDALETYRLKLLKEMGCNAIRTSHNPPSPELLDACDRIGLLVMDENRLIGSADWIKDQLATQVLRDRNHPSVFLWSIGNEEPEGSTARGQRVAKAMVALVHQLDPTRPTTYAGNNGNEYEGINSQVDVRGWNYLVLGDPDKYHRDHPDQPVIGTEEASTLSTRGQYPTDSSKGFVSAYDTDKPNWGTTAEQWWTYYASRPYLAGAFVWTGFDYRGEPTPYSWPNISSQFGVLDTCGFPKDNFYYYQAWWSNEDVLHVLPHWNWTGKEGQPIQVWCYSNQDEAELLLNGKSLGRKPVPRNGHVEWTVPYVPGTLEARGYRGGKLVKSEKVETTDGAAQLVLTADRASIGADGEDVAVLTVSALDGKGRMVPLADNDVALAVAGGNLIGVGNGDPTSHEPDKFIADDFLLQSAGWKINYSVPADLSQVVTPDYDDSDWRPIDINHAANQLLSDGQKAIIRGFVDLPGIQPKSNVELRFSEVKGSAEVYLNGARVGVATKSGATFSVEALAQGGRNYLTLILTNGKGEGGMGGGVSIHLVGPDPVWHRKLFAGLAQALVQSTTTPGTIKITATSPGLKPASLEIKASPAPFRGSP